MIQFAIFKKTTTGFHFFLFIFLLLFFALLSILTSMAVSVLLFDVPMTDLLSLSLSDDGINIARIMQIISQLGVFVIPPVSLALLVTEKPDAFLGFKKPDDKMILWIGIIVMFSLLPLIHQLSAWNESIQLPSSFAAIEEWMLEKEKQAEEISLKFLEVSTFGGLMVNILMIGILPSVGEELVFRSILQPMFGKWLRNIHLGIIVSAILFSMMHMQFYGFLPRMGLGIVLGYFYFWSGSIFVPMLMHFVNNGSAVLVFYLAHNGFIHTNAEEFGSSSDTIVIVLSAFLSIGLLYSAYRKKV
jgi:membrane protease YdiL (CAAX protease family)